MTFQSAQAVEEVVWQMLLFEYDRALDRARINRLFNGAPPLSPHEQEENQIGTNVNDLSATKIDHDARRQFDNAFVVPEPLFNISLDWGPAHRRQQWGSRITKELNKILINSQEYLDLRQGVFASVVLHGIGPSFWETRKCWKQTELGVEDVLIPGRTLRNLKNLPFLALYRRYSGMELYKLTHGPKVDKAWNMPMVKDAIKWVDDETHALMGTDWPETWYPEKIEERYKENSGLYAGDSVPTIDTYDFYFYDEGDNAGWRRRIIIDQWGVGGTGGIYTAKSQRPEKNSKRYKWGKDEFLFDSKDRVVAPNLSEIIHFQFGDASAVAPFRYHTIRSLGFLLYAVCHVQNRVKCRFTDAVFESLMQYFRVANANDWERVSKIDLIDKGIVPEGVNFVRPEERWKLDPNLPTALIQMNRQTMSDVSASFTQDYDLAEEEKGRETATRTMAKVNSTAAMVGSMLNKSYSYEKFRALEICRRFTIPGNQDPDIKRFRLNCLKSEERVPLEALDVNKWEVKMNRVVGGGNDMMQVAIAEKLMQVRNLHGPEAQHEILRFYDATVTKDYAFANELNPEQPHISDSVHDTEIVFGTLMGGTPVRPRPGLNAAEVAQTMIHLMEFKVQEIQKAGGVGTPHDLQGFIQAILYTEQFIQQLAQDKQNKRLVKMLQDQMKIIGNFVKAFQQRQQEMAQKAAQQNGAGGMDPEKLQKLMFEREKNKLKLDAQTKAQAQRMAQRQLQFQAEEQRDAREHASQLRRDDQAHALEVHHARREHAAQVQQDLLEHGAELAKNTREAMAQARMRSMEGETEEE